VFPGPAFDSCCAFELLEPEGLGVVAGGLELEGCPELLLELDEPLLELLVKPFDVEELG
jgi:hypothetical protein